MDIKKLLRLDNIEDYLKLDLFSLTTGLWLTSMKYKYYAYRILHKYARYNPILQFTSNLENQKELITKREFDVLIVLDACRYDVFSRVVYKYLDGKLKAVVSPASVTIDWLKATWLDRERRDTIYVSATPMVNKRSLLKSFDAKHIFYDIVEVWDWGWSNDLGTVPPNKVNLGVKVALSRAKLKGLKFPGMMRLVVHYVQPHSPYVMLGSVLSKLSKYDDNKRTNYRLCSKKVRQICWKILY